MRRTFNVISVIENDDIDFDDLTLTQHWSKQRMIRNIKTKVITNGNSFVKKRTKVLFYFCINNE